MSEVVRLGDVCTVVSGSTPKTNISEYWDGDVKWITPAELNEDSFYIFDTQRRITQLGKEKTGLSLMPIGTVILSSRAPIGKTAIAGCELCCNQGFKNLICSDKIFNEYLYYYLSAKTDYLNSLGRGATFKEISKAIVENILIPLPNIEEQHKRATLFASLNALVNKRKQQLSKLDELVKSRFIEMFGDTVINPYNWNKEPLGKVCDVRDGTHDSPLYYDVGFPLITSKNLSSGDIDFTDCSLICQKDYDKINERSKVDYGDILMPMIGTVGNPVIVKIKREFTIKNVALIKFYTDTRVSNVYIQTLLKSDYFYNEVISKVRGGTQKFISLGDIRKLEVLVPPIDLQNQFATFVEQTDKLKFEVKESLEKLETLKKSLMQKYFG